ncbi:hypothetical protein ACFSQ7_00905 [Paenibacillus rhizoplanae]
MRRAKRNGYEHVVDLDIVSFFDEIPHEGLMEKVRERITDGKSADAHSRMANGGNHGR